MRGLIGFTVAAAFFFGFNFYLKKDSLLFYPDSTEFIYGNLAGMSLFMGFMIMVVASFLNSCRMARSRCCDVRSFFRRLCFDRRLPMTSGAPAGELTQPKVVWFG